MTEDQQRPQRDRPRPSDSPGIARRTAVAAAWTALVIAAAVAAPGASASPAPVTASTFVGVTVTSLRVGTFGVTGFINMIGTPGSVVQLAEETWMDITTDHDVSRWDGRLVVIGPRAARLIIPVGPYPVARTYMIRGQTVSLAFAGATYTSSLTAEPKGRFIATATVTRGPVYVGPDPSAASQFGATTSTARVPN